VRLDVSEYLLERRFRGVGWERLEDSIGAGLADGRDYVVECVGTTCKESDGKITMRSVGEYTGNSRAL